MKEWTFDYRRNGMRWSFPVYRSSEGNYYIRHAKTTDIPEIREELEGLWKGTLAEGSPPSDRVRDLARFEWLWYRANPFGRAGASTGALLSVLLRKRLEADGVRTRIPETFAVQDHDALSLSLEAYVDRRVVELTVIRE